MILVINLRRLRLEDHAARKGELTYARQQMENPEIEGPRGEFQDKVHVHAVLSDTIGAICVSEFWIFWISEL